MTQKRFSFRRILNNNKIVFIISLVLAIVIWFVVAMQFSDPQETVLNDVPVTIDTTMSNQVGLQMFGNKDLTVSVKVKGKRYEVSSLTLSADDLVATANTANVSSAGKYSLPVTVRTRENRDVEIVSHSPESLDVYFDYLVTNTYPVEVQVVPPEGTTDIAAAGYLADDPIASKTEVTISGASKEIDNIDKVIAKVTLTEPLQETHKSTVSLSIVNKNNGIVRSSYFEIDDDVSEVSVTIPIYKITQFKPSIKFKNTPAYFSEHPIEYICAPSGMVNAAVNTNLLDQLDEVSLGTIDFADIKIGTNVFTFRSDEIQNIRVTDEIDEFRVYFAISGFRSRTFTLTADDIAFDALPSDGTVSLAEDATYAITVIGLPEEVEALTEDNLKASVDASGLNAQADPYALPIKVSIEGTTSCWVSGHSTANVTVS